MRAWAPLLWAECGEGIPQGTGLCCRLGEHQPGVWNAIISLVWVQPGHLLWSAVFKAYMATVPANSFLNLEQLYKKYVNFSKIPLIPWTPKALKKHIFLPSLFALFYVTDGGLIYLSVKWQHLKLKKKINPYGVLYLITAVTKKLITLLRTVNGGNIRISNWNTKAKTVFRYGLLRCFKSSFHKTWV